MIDVNETIIIYVVYLLIYESMIIINDNIVPILYLFYRMLFKCHINSIAAFSEAD